MPVPTDITAGTITITNGSTAVTGVGTAWLASDIRQGDLFIWIDGGDGFWQPIVESVESNTALTLAEVWEGPTLTGVAYRLRYQWDSSRVSAQSRQLIELLGNGNIEALSGLTGPGVPVFNGPHSMVVKPESDFINGVAYNVQVDTLADRAAYDAQAAGFSVLVSDVGDGRSAIFSKASNTSGDWTDAAYITGATGATGASATITVDTTTTLPPGSSATVTSTPVTGGIELDFGIPAGEGFVARGAYSGATAYVKGDVVTDNGSSWIAKISTTGNAPPTLPTTSNTQWELLAARGANGTGTGDVVGPASAVDNHIAVFDGTTGKLIKDGGSTIAALVPADGSITNAKLVNMATARIKGRATAGTGVPEDLTGDQVATIIGGYPATRRLVLAGTANAITLASTVPLATGLAVRFRATSANTGATTIAYAGGSAVACRTITGVALPAGYIRTDVDTIAVYDGTYWVLGRETERGSNANGFYTRFADGTLLCGRDTISIPASLTTVTWAASFVDAVYAAVGTHQSNFNTAITAVKFWNFTATTAQVLLPAMTSGSNTVAPATGSISMSAQGYWY